MKRVYLILGGFWGVDGYLTSAGMYRLRSMLRAVPDTTVVTYQWGSWQAAANDILANQAKHKTVVIGYSGGGSRATWIANHVKRPRIDLMVTYDPSPKWQMLKIGANVKRAVTYQNDQPFMFGLGCGVLVGKQVETIEIHQPHSTVQSNMELHRRTVAMVGSV